MSIAPMALMIIGCIIGMYVLVADIRKKHRKERLCHMLYRFSKLGTQYDLSFASQEVLKDSIIGLDGLKRKLLLLEKQDRQFNWTIIDLNELSQCSLQETHLNVQREEELNTGSSGLALRFDFEDNRAPVMFPFCKHDDSSGENHLYERARDWEAILSKMIIKKQRA